MSHLQTSIDRYIQNVPDDPPVTRMTREDYVSEDGQRSSAIVDDALAAFRDDIHDAIYDLLLGSREHWERIGRDIDKYLAKRIEASANDDNVELI